MRSKVGAGLAIVGICALVGLAGCGGSSSGGVDQSSPASALKAYDLAWAEGDAKGACELLGDAGRAAVEKEMSNRTLGALPLNCPARMNEVLELLGPESKAQLEELAEKTGSAKVEKEGRGAEVEVGPRDFMILGEVNGKWFIGGNTIHLINPMLLTQHEIEVEEAKEAEEAEELETEEAEIEPAETPEEHAREQEGESELKTEGANNRRKAEALTGEDLETQFGERIIFTECPEEIYVSGLTFTCDASAESGTHYQAELEVTDEAGDLVVVKQYVSHEH
ncbi:MAG: hypothetical protein JSS68_15080 [Actinobacteria bacterium]|nr:hypothetical protein [Actinomycetota bacterium]